MVEDEYFIAMELVSVLIDGGFEVFGPASTVAAALESIKRQQPDAAVLDVNLDGEWVTPVAHLLQSLGVPFVLATALNRADLHRDDLLAGAVNVGKPTKPEHLLKSLRKLLDSGC